MSGYTYQGCYTEATQQRALTGTSYYNDYMTVEKCAAACNDFDWFGVEYRRECFCGNSVNAGSVLTDESECSSPCPGDSTETCGAGNRLNMYNRLSTIATSSTSSSTLVAPTPGNYAPKGCYIEATSGRALTGKIYFDDAMTIEKCSAACTGFMYFGLEYYRECYCGNQLEAGSGPAGSSDSNHPCTGDKSETCGGDNRLNIYTVSGGGTTTSSALATPTPKNYALQGCYSEGSNSRALIGATYYDDKMTTDKCAGACKGFVFFGTEYARECYCGNVLQAGSEEASLSDCSIVCPGDKAETCGGNDRLDLYRFDATTSTFSTSTTSTTLSTSTTSTTLSTSMSSTTSSIVSIMTATPTASSTCSTPTINVLSNGGFESGASAWETDGWALDPSESYVFDLANKGDANIAPHSGSQMALAMVKANDVFGLISQPFRPVPAVDYTMSVWWRAPVGSNGCGITFYINKPDREYIIAPSPTFDANVANQGHWEHTVANFNAQSFSPV